MWDREKKMKGANPLSSAKPVAGVPQSESLPPFVRDQLAHGRSPWAVDHGENCRSSNRLFQTCTFDKSQMASLRAMRREVAAKQVICQKGEPGSYLFVVVTGRVKIAAPSVDGREITLSILESGQMFGEEAVLEGTDYGATATALERTELSVIERREFLLYLDREPAVARALLTALCARLRTVTELAQDLSFLPLPERLGKTLLALARVYGTQTAQGLRIGLHLCQQELANLVGTSRESVNKQLGAWQAEGLIAMKQGLITVQRLPNAPGQTGSGRTDSPRPGHEPLSPIRQAPRTERPSSHRLR